MITLMFLAAVCSRHIELNRQNHTFCINILLPCSFGRQQLNTVFALAARSALETVPSQARYIQGAVAFLSPPQEQCTSPGCAPNSRSQTSAAS